MTYKIIASSKGLWFVQELWNFFFMSHSSYTHQKHARTYTHALARTNKPGGPGPGVEPPVRKIEDCLQLWVALKLGKARLA